MKVVICFFILAVLAVTAEERSREPRKTFIDCNNLQPEDVTLLTRNIKKRGKWFQKVHAAQHFPEMGAGDGSRIHCIKIIDWKWQNGADGSTISIEGGIGFQWLIVNIESARGESIDVDVEIYGNNL